MSINEQPMPLALTNPPIGTAESAIDILQTIALALHTGYTPAEILDENSPVANRILAEVRAQRSSQWKTVDSAPSDVMVLLYSPHRHATNPERIESGVFHNTRCGTRHAWATHWMPLPACPTTRGRNEEEEFATAGEDDRTGVD